MPFFLDIEKIGSRASRFTNLALNCAVAGGVTAVMITLMFGYEPNPALLLILPFGVLAGSVGGGLFGLLLCYAVLREQLTNRIFSLVTLSGIIAGGAGALVARLVTHEAGGWLGAFPGMIGIAAAAAWFRFSRRSTAV
jgi:hypothetical protein